MTKPYANVQMAQMITEMVLVLKIVELVHLNNSRAKTKNAFQKVGCATEMMTAVTVRTKLIPNVMKSNADPTNGNVPMENVASPRTGDVITTRTVLTVVTSIAIQLQLAVPTSSNAKTDNASPTNGNVILKMTAWTDRMKIQTLVAMPEVQAKIPHVDLTNLDAPDLPNVCLCLGNVMETMIVQMKKTKTIAKKALVMIGNLIAEKDIAFLRLGDVMAIQVCNSMLSRRRSKVSFAEFCPFFQIVIMAWTNKIAQQLNLQILLRCQDFPMPLNVTNGHSNVTTANVFLIGGNVTVPKIAPTKVTS